MSVFVLVLYCLLCRRLEICFRIYAADEVLTRWSEGVTGHVHCTCGASVALSCF